VIADSIVPSADILQKTEPSSQSQKDSIRSIDWNGLVPWASVKVHIGPLPQEDDIPER
jgi:hypothetical protein